jgi:hypothetical protein
MAATPVSPLSMASLIDVGHYVHTHGETVDIECALPHGLVILHGTAPDGGAVVEVIRDGAHPASSWRGLARHTIPLAHVHWCPPDRTPCPRCPTPVGPAAMWRLARQICRRLATTRPGRAATGPLTADELAWLRASQLLIRTAEGTRR